jgi:hypothetical protein
MIANSTRDRVVHLAESRMVPLDRALVNGMSSKTQEVMDRGFYNSSIQVVGAKGVAEDNLTQRAELITNTIREVCESQCVRYSAGLADELKRLFDEIYQKQIESVRKRFDKAVPESNKRLCPITQFGPDVSRYTEELALFADGLKHRKGKSGFWRELVRVTIIFLAILIPMILAAKAIEWWMVPVPIVTTVLAFIVVVAVALRRSGDITEGSFAKIILATIDKLPHLSSSSHSSSETPDEPQDGA